MHAFMRLAVLLATLILPVAAVYAEGRSTAVITITDARIRHLNGTPYLTPFSHDDYRTGGTIVTERAGTDRRIESNDNNYTFWELSHCDGICNSGFPPVERQVFGSGYIRSISTGAMPLNSDAAGSSLVRTDAAATDVGTVPSRGNASAYNIFEFIAQTSEPLNLYFAATPYIEQYFAPGTAVGSVNTAQLRFRVTLLNKTTGLEIFSIEDPLLNGDFSLEADRSGASFIFDPGRGEFTYSFGELSAGDTYELTMMRQASASVLLAVPEPASSTLYFTGLLVITLGWRLRRTTHQATRCKETRAEPYTSIRARLASILRNTWTAFAMGWLLCSPAAAVTPYVLYDNGPTIGTGYNTSSRWIANDFVLNDSVSLQALHLYMIYDAPLDLEQVEWEIYSDNAGQLGTLVGSASAAGTRTLLSSGTLFSNYLVDLTFPEILTLDPGRYWLAIHAVSFYPIFWADAAQNGTLSRQYLEHGSTEWAPLPGESAFQILGVPEPAQVILLGLGLVSMFVLRRRERFALPAAT